MRYSMREWVSIMLTAEADILYLRAHKAAYPERFPVKEQSRALYPMLEGIESRYGPTAVHLQVYDGENIQSRWETYSD